MNKTAFKKIISALSLTIILWAASAHLAHASVWDALTPWDTIWTVLSNLMQAILTATSWLVTLTGTLLNVAVFLTTNLGPFIKDTAVIYSVWSIIRDLASIALIFVILWAAIQMILNVKQPNYASLLKSIVIMGILINFSFFFTQVLIDASNIVSLQFFNAITPGKTYTSGSTLANMTSKAFNDGGLSNVFMGSLSVTSWYNNKGVVGATSGNTATDPHAAPIRIFLIGFAGMIVMILASMSFLAAAAICILRTAMLILLLAFSPVWVASWAMPELKEAANPWWKQFKVQLLFLPIYLMFMYVAIRILTESGLSKLTTGTGGALINTSDISSYTSLFVGFVIIIIMLNVPLFAAISVAGAGGTLTEKWFKGAQSWLGRNTMGRAASRVNESNVMRRFYAANPRVGEFTQRQISKVSGASFVSGKDSLYGLGSKAGFDKARKEKIAATKKMSDSLGFDSRKVAAGLELKNKAIDSEIKTRQDNMIVARNLAAGATDPAARAVALERAKLLEEQMKNISDQRQTDLENERNKLEGAYTAQRKGQVAENFENRRSSPAMLARFVTGGRILKGPNKYNKLLAKAIRKEKTKEEKLVDLLKDEVKPEGGEAKGGAEKPAEGKKA